MKIGSYFQAKTRYVYNICNENEYRRVKPLIKCNFLPIDIDNYCRVSEFREKEQVVEYRQKVLNGEIGFFGEHNNLIVSSIWATLNGRRAPIRVRGYFKLLPNEVLIHDIVTGIRCRGNGIGPYMVNQIVPILLQDYGVTRILIDVYVRNTASVNMMKKLELKKQQKILYITLLSKYAFQIVLKDYRRA